ncbi:hypothetical protein E2P81_ATG05176 [Venturia nashicola]|uniref:Uncharacterized protein n=1 Tax=Venturia nashicola TaxID=86259 RepID=A0A4Z1PD08_9PEZI|nr:hypothetical protein E6O75_ATG05304 [Venturia nashicola]TLD32200.1 hypothetical protein E2P81_ATG05176 [Venturia nashicola]
MPFPLVLGGVVIAAIPKTRHGVLKGYDAAKGGIDTIRCKFGKCQFLLPEVQLQQDSNPKNITISDLNFTFGVPGTINPFLPGRGACGIPTVQFEVLSSSLSRLSGGAVEFNGVPKSCMNLSNTMAASCAIGPQTSPVHCGEACLKYSNLNADQLAQLSSVLTHA